MERNRIFFTLILTIIAVSAHAGSNNESHDAQVPELIQAAQSDDLDTVNRLISAGVDLEVRDNRRNTALMMAVQANHVNVAQVLIDAGANIEARNHKGSIPLMCATSAEAAQLLIAAGADVNAVRPSGMTALMFASQNGHEAVVRLLLQYHANPNATKTTDGVTALMFASQDGHEAVVRLLLQNHANPNATLPDGGTALMSASQNGHEAVVRLLLQHHADPNATGTTDNGMTALMFASQNGHEAVVRLLLQHHVDPATRTTNGWTALMIASDTGHVAVVRLLLQHHADPNATRTTDGVTALMFASKNGHINAVRALIIAGANLNTTTHRGMRAFAVASAMRHEKIVTLLAAAEKYGTGAAQQPAQSLQEAIQEYCYRKAIFDEIELQYKTALKHRNEIADIDQRACALRQQLARFAEQRRQKLLQAEPTLKTCKNLALQFVERGSPLSEAVAEPLLDSDSFENFHVKLITAAQSNRPTNTNNTRNNRLLEMHNELLGTFSDSNVSTLTAKMILSRSNYRQLRALITQRNAQRSLSELPAPRVASQDTYCTIL